MIRKAMTIILAGLLMCCLAACGGGSDPVVGKYSFSHMEAMGMTMNAEALEGFGMEVSSFVLEMKDDGTFVMTAPFGDGNEPETGEGTWEKSDDGYTMTVEGESINATYDANAKTMSLTMGDIASGEEGSIVFKK